MDRIFQISIYVTSLFFFWSLAPLILLLVSLPLARKLGIIANLRGYASLLVPLFAAFERTLSLFMKLVWPLAFLVVWSGGQQGVPPIGTPDRLLANQIFGAVFVVYMGAILPISFGMPLVATAKGLQSGSKSILVLVRWSVGALAGIVVFSYPGEYGWAGALCGVAYVVILGSLTIRAVAWANFHETPAANVQTGREVGRLYFLQLSDMHATFPVGSEPAGGGQTGVYRLASIAERLTAKTGEPLPKLLIDTGDIIDRGLESEWDEPLKSLRKIKEEAGIRVVIAPGNHDLVPSYDFSAAFWAVTGKRFTLPEMDGARLLKYLSVASELEPQLLTSTGSFLKEVVDSESHRLEQLTLMWDSARDRAQQALGTTGLGHLWAMKRLQLQHPSISDEVAADFAARAHVLFREWDEAEWRRLLFASSPEQMIWGLPYRIWDARWTDLFPLRLEIAEDNVEVLIMNSIAKEARLAGSARGRCGTEQLERLRGRLDISRAKVVIILQHHPPFRFPIGENEPVVQRWAMLAHDPLESVMLARLLTEAATTERQIMVLSGHIHMRSRCGQLETPEGFESEGRHPIWVLESGALGETITDVVPSGWITESGFIEPRLMPEPQ